MQEQGPSLLIIQDSEGKTFGGFASSSWRVSERYYGNGETFVFSFAKKMSRPVIPLMKQLKMMGEDGVRGLSSSAFDAVSVAMKELDSWRGELKKREEDERMKREEAERSGMSLGVSATEAFDAALRG